jgi:quinol monooxygenase YgiN
MSLIAVEATLTVADPSTRDAVVAASIPFQAATRDDEAGCLVYCFAADPLRPAVIQVYELWEDEATLAAHFEHPNYAAMRTMLNGSGLASAVSRKFRIQAESPVYGPDHVPLVGFGTA